MTVKEIFVSYGNQETGLKSFEDMAGGSQQIDFFDSGYSYSQEGAGFGYPQEQTGGNYGGYYGEYDQTFNAAPGYGSPQPNMMNEQQNSYGFNEQMSQGGAEYASFEDEPPLLEGVLSVILYLCIFSLL